jgi:hypothetical protein
MRGAALWVLGASAAFLVTAAAFLLLANLGSEPTSDPIPQAVPSAPESVSPVLALELPEYRLERLERGPGQRLALNVQNASEEELPVVNLTLVITSENTLRPRPRYYWAATENLAPGATTAVEFEIDLSPPPIPTESSLDPQESREILEIRATTPEGDSAVKTAVLAR